LTPVFFTDRDLGKLIPELLRKAGINVEKHSDHFRHDARDEEWLTEAGRRNWFCLTHNWRIRYKPNEKDAVMRAGVGLFILAGSATHQELANNLVNTFHNIERFIENHNRPFIAKIYRPSKKLRSLSGNRPGHVELWLSYEEWVKGEMEKWGSFCKLSNNQADSAIIPLPKFFFHTPALI